MNADGQKVPVQSVLTVGDSFGEHGLLNEWPQPRAEEKAVSLSADTCCVVITSNSFHHACTVREDKEVTLKEKFDVLYKVYPCLAPLPCP